MTGEAIVGRRPKVLTRGRRPVSRWVCVMVRAGGLEPPRYGTPDDERRKSGEQMTTDVNLDVEPRRLDPAHVH
jgi:hypothetical protein